MNFKFDIGDYVRIQNSPPANINEGPTWADTMSKHCGHIGRIIYRKEADHSRKEPYIIYHIEKAGSYWWDERWLQSYLLMDKELFEI